MVPKLQILPVSLTNFWLKLHRLHCCLCPVDTRLGHGHGAAEIQCKLWARTVPKVPMQRCAFAYPYQPNANARWPVPVWSGIGTRHRCHLEIMPHLRNLPLIVMLTAVYAARSASKISDNDGGLRCWSLGFANANSRNFAWTLLTTKRCASTIEQP